MCSKVTLHQPFLLRYRTFNSLHWMAQHQVAGQGQTNTAYLKTHIKNLEIDNYINIIKYALNKLE